MLTCMLTYVKAISEIVPRFCINTWDHSNRLERENRLSVIDKQLEPLKAKLSNLYDAVETGKLDIDDLAPRIKALKAEIGLMQTKRNEIVEEAQQPKATPFDLTTLKNSVHNLAHLLGKGSIFEQKSFLQSFIKKIVVNHPEVIIHYNIPIIKEKGRTSTIEVLPSAHIGSPE